MGQFGPIPKRSSEVLGHRTAAEMAERTATQIAGAEHVEIPHPAEEWHPVARRWFESLAESGQCDLYEPSDWATACYVAHTMDRHLQASGTLGQGMFSAVMSAANDLLSTEGARRRVQVETQRPNTDDHEPAGLAAIAEYRKRLTG